MPLPYSPGQLDATGEERFDAGLTATLAPGETVRLKVRSSNGRAFGIDRLLTSGGADLRVRVERGDGEETLLEETTGGLVNDLFERRRLRFPFLFGQRETCQLALTLSDAADSPETIGARAFGPTASAIERLLSAWERHGPSGESAPANPPLPRLLAGSIDVSAGGQGELSLDAPQGADARLWRLFFDREAGGDLLLSIYENNRPAIREAQLALITGQHQAQPSAPPLTFERAAPLLITVSNPTPTAATARVLAESYTLS